MKVRVKVRVYATLRRYLPQLQLGQALELDLPSDTTICGLIEQLGIPRGEAKVCFVNGVQRDVDHFLQEDDELGLFPPIGGGWQ